MIEFNSDGSIKLPAKAQEQENKNQWKMKNSICIQIKKDIVSHTAPKKCMLHFSFSDKITNAKFVSVILDQFKEDAKTPMSLNISESVAIEIGTNFKRCTECNDLIGRFRQHVYGNLILKKGNCTFEPRNNFDFEDYFE